MIDIGNNHIAKFSISSKLTSNFLDKNLHNIIASIIPKTINIPYQYTGIPNKLNASLGINPCFYYHNIITLPSYLNKIIKGIYRFLPCRSPLKIVNNLSFYNT